MTDHANGTQAITCTFCYTAGHHVLDCPEIDPEQLEIQRAACLQGLADAFATQLRAEMGDEDYHAACQANYAEVDAAICHTHDYCDANVVLDEVVTRVLGRGLVASSEEDAALADLIWERWRETYCTDLATIIIATCATCERENVPCYVDAHYRICRACAVSEANYCRAHYSAEELGEAGDGGILDVERAFAARARQQ